MSYTQYIYKKWYDDGYETNVEWVKTKYEEYGDRIVFSNISPSEDGFIASVIVKDLPEPEPQPEQHKIQL